MSDTKSDKKVPEDVLSKALETLQDLSKGHSSRGTATTKVESMRDAGAGAGSDAGSTQVHHTPSNSDPNGWAGSQARKSPEDGASDAVEENGTDYNAGAEVVKSILTKLAKGLPLTAEEATVYASFAKSEGREVTKAGAVPPKMAEKPEKEEEDDDEPVGKSLTDMASENEDVNKGFEMSQFLVGWADVNSKALDMTRKSLQTPINELAKSVKEMKESDDEFKSELAKSISSLADVLTIQSQRIEQLEATPARGPKSAGVAPIEKGFGPGGPDVQNGEQLTKSQVSTALEDLVIKGQLSPTEVVKFESNGVLSPQVEQQVRAHLAGR